MRIMPRLVAMTARLQLRWSVVYTWTRAATGPLTSAVMALAVVAAIVLTDHDAGASSSLDSNYGYDRTWNAALRMVRVDMGFKVTEKDEQNGYLIFEYTSPEGGNKPSSGSMELVRSKDADQTIHVIVQLNAMPRYHEQVMLDSLARKMRQEYGEPPSHPSRAPSAPDAGPDGS